MFSEILGLMEKKLSNAHYFEKKFQDAKMKYRRSIILNLQKIYILYWKIWFTVLIGQNLPMSSKSFRSKKKNGKSAFL